MLHSSRSYHKTRRGNVVQINREHYLRDDIWCGSEACTICKQSSEQIKLPRLSNKENNIYAILHSSIMLHQIDLLENNTIKNCIVFQSSLNEVKKSSVYIYNRIKKIISDTSRCWYLFSNDYHRETFIKRTTNDSFDSWYNKLLYKAYHWYNDHLSSTGISCIIVLNTLPNDDSIFKNTNYENILTYIKRYEKENPELIDLIVNPNITNSNLNKNIYDEYLNKSLIKEGISSGELFQGVFNSNPTNCFEGIVRKNNDNEDNNNNNEILISGKKHINRAIDSDIVVVKLLPESEWIKPSELLIENEINDNDNINEELLNINKQLKDKSQPTGKIVGIISRKWKPCTGSLLPPKFESKGHQSQSILFLPSDKKLPKIRIRTRQASNLMNKILVVGIDEWPCNSNYPLGHYIKQIGKCGDKESESEALLIQYDIPYHPFSDNVIACLPSMPWKITENDRKERKDFRDLNIVSIDPVGCTDIDDALHIRTLDNGNYEVGVHIADVTHFVKSNTAIDKEAAARGNTVYLVDKRIDMLPKLLGENLCSLRSNVERFAFSVLWEIDSSSYNIINNTFTKSIIKSRESFTYGEAQARIDDLSLNDNITKSLRLLNKVSKVLRERRMNRGALTLASPEVRFKKSEESSDPIDGPELYEMKETNALVEEFMLLANTSVAKKIYKQFPHVSLLRRHPAPPRNNFETLCKVAKIKNIKLDCDDSKELANSLNNAIFKDSYLNTLLRIMTTRCMLQAVYFCSGTLKEEQFLHYGLAEPIYTHFTSPIRRYADIIVHRLLSACLNISSDTANLNVQSVRKICDVLNKKHKLAQNASIDSNALFTMLFFKDKNIEEDAYVTKIKANGFIVLVPKYGIENIVFTSTPNGPNPFNFNEELQILEKNDKSIKISLMMKVKVKIFVESHQINRPKLRLNCLEPYIKPPFEEEQIDIKQQNIRPISKESQSPPLKKQKI